MSDLHEAVFTWPATDASDVILTGTFDAWSRSTRLTKGPSGFEGRVNVPWGSHVLYKWIVDGQWVTDSNATERDSDGNVNNVYIAPPRPAPAPQPIAEVTASGGDVKEQQSACEAHQPSVAVADTSLPTREQSGLVDAAMNPPATPTTSAATAKSSAQSSLSKSQHAFPGSNSPTPTKSAGSTTSKRKKTRSIFGTLKSLFDHDPHGSKREKGGTTD